MNTLRVLTYFILDFGHFVIITPKNHPYKNSVIHQYYLQLFYFFKITVIITTYDGAVSFHLTLFPFTFSMIFRNETFESNLPFSFMKYLHENSD